MDDKNIYISHHGIMGMKWGVWNDETRRKRMGGGRQRASNPRKEQISRERSVRKAAKYSSLLSDKELDKRIKRLEKEKRLRELTASELTPGKKAVSGFLSKHGDKVAAIIIGTVAKELISESIGKRKRNIARVEARRNRVRSSIGNTVRNVASGYGVIGPIN